MYWRQSFVIVLIGATGLLSCSDYGSDPVPPGPSQTGSLSVGDTTATEGESATFVIMVGEPIDSVIAFNWSISLLSASVGDFAGATSGSDTIPAHSSEVVITIPIFNDGIEEGSELFTFSIGSPVNADISRGTALGVISPNDGGVDISWSGDVRPKFQTFCVTCHGGSGGFFISTVQNIKTTGDHAPNVLVGNGAGSNLFRKLTSTPPFGVRMPNGGPYFSAAQIDTIRLWIDQGAKDN